MFKCCCAVDLSLGLGREFQRAELFPVPSLCLIIINISANMILYYYLRQQGIGNVLIISVIFSVILVNRITDECGN